MNYRGGREEDIHSFCKFFFFFLRESLPLYLVQERAKQVWKIFVERLLPQLFPVGYAAVVGSGLCAFRNCESEIRK